MARTRKAGNEGESAGAAEQRPTTLPEASALPLAAKGINSSADFRNLMSALMSDVIQERISPNTVNAACNAGGKMLKMVELEYKFASGQVRNERVLALAGASA